MQPRIDGLTIDDHAFIATERVCELRMLRLDQEPALVLVAWVQQLEIQSLVDLRVFGSVARGEDRPDSDVDLLADLPPGLSLFRLGRAEADLEALLAPGWT